MSAINTEEYKRVISPPKTCLLTVSNTCHLKCKMCDLWTKKTEPEELSIDEYKKFVADLQAFEGEPIELHLIGGETFVKDGIFDLISFARRGGSRVIVTTSGYSITEEVAQKIAESDLSMINFSLESLHAETHDFLRGVSGVHKKVMNAIDYVSHAAPNIEMAINTIIVKNNLYDLVPLVEWVNTHPRFSQIYFMAVMRPFGSDLDLYWQESERARLLWPDSYKKTEDVLNQLIGMRSTGAKIGNSIGQLNVFKSYFKDPRNFIKRTGCTIADHALNINALGDAYLCFFMEKIGNVRDSSPQELWFSDTAAVVREKIKACRQNCELVVNCYYEDEE